MSETSYQRAAKMKWPGFLIHGDGPFALICGDTHSVKLYDFWMLAMSDVARDHSNWNCKDCHRLIELKPAPAPGPLALLRLPAEMERD